MRTYTNLRHGHRRQCVSCIRNRGRLDLSYDAGASRGRREAGRYVCHSCGVVRGAKGGEGVSPYVGICMGGIGWNYEGPLIG